MLISVSPEAKKWLENYCLLTGKSEEDAANEALRHLTRAYQADDGGELVKGKYLGKDCFVLGKCTMYGAAYVRIVMDGHILKCPEKDVDYETH